MKKIFKIALIALIVILASTLNIYATTETTSVTLTIDDKSEVKIGDIVTISLSAKCDEGIEGIDSTLEYDETKLELQNLNVNSKFSNMSGTDDSTGEYKITVISNSSETLTSETFATLEFEVLDAAQVDEELTIKLSAIEIGDSNDEWTAIEDKEVVVQVIEETPEQGDNNNPGTENNGDNNNNDNNDDNNNNDNNNNQSTNKENNKDNTQANKPIDKAGLKDYAFIIIPIISVIAFISYKKYKQYKNI